MERFENDNFTWEDMIEVLLDIIHFYNLLLKGVRFKDEKEGFPLEEIEWEEYAKKFAEKYGDYRKWLIDYRKSTLDDYVEEEEKVA